jgi:hypothetical protein
MIAIAIILALSAVVIAALAVFWKNILEWIKKAVNKIREVLGLTPEGTRTFLTKTSEGLKNKSKYYYKSKVTTEWEEVVYTKAVDESEVPADILAKARGFALNEDIPTTEELRNVITV